MSNLKPGELILFPNKDKQAGDKKPYYKGHGLDLDGNEIEIFLWVKPSMKGSILSGRIQPKHTKLDS